MYPLPRLRGRHGAAVFRERQVVQQDHPFDPFDGGGEDVEIGEDARVVDEYLHLGAQPCDGGVQLLRRLHARHVHDKGIDRDAVRRRQLLPCGVERAAVAVDENQPVARCRQPFGIAAADAVGGARHERRLRIGCDRVLFHRYGSFASSSRILRGRSGQCLQHCMSSEYMRAMQ